MGYTEKSPHLQRIRELMKELSGDENELQRNGVLTRREKRQLDELYKRLKEQNGQQ